MGDIQIGHHIPSAVKLAEVVQGPDTATVIIQLQDTAASPVAD